MSSKLTPIYADLIAKIESILPAYYRIPNPYSAETNSFQLMKKGYGLAIGPGDNTERNLGCKLSIRRTFTLILVNQVTTTDNHASVRGGLEVSLMEDLYLIIAALETDPDLSQNVIAYKYIADTGIELLQAENQKARFYGVEATLECEYTEVLT